MPIIQFSHSCVYVVKLCPGNPPPLEKVQMFLQMCSAGAIWLANGGLWFGWGFSQLLSVPVLPRKVVARMRQERGALWRNVWEQIRLFLFCDGPGLFRAAAVSGVVCVVALDFRGGGCLLSRHQPGLGLLRFPDGGLDIGFARQTIALEDFLP